MAFILANMQPIGGNERRGDSPMLWSYASAADNLAAVKASGYFDSISTLLSPDDVIMLQDSGAMGFIQIAAITAGVVTTKAADINAA